MSVQAIEGEAIAFPAKPFREQDLLDAVQQGLAQDREWLENKKATATLRARFETLTLREREVMALVVTGRLNKQIAFEIGISEIAVKASRGQVVRKMNAATLPTLARMADKLNLTEEVRKLSSPRMSSARSSGRTITAGHHSGFCRVSQLLATRRQLKRSPLTEFYND